MVTGAAAAFLGSSSRALSSAEMRNLSKHHACSKLVDHQLRIVRNVFVMAERAYDKQKKDDDEEAAKSAKKWASDAASRSTSSIDVSVNSDVLEKMRKADDERAKNSQQGGENTQEGDKKEDPDGKVNDAIVRLFSLPRVLNLCCCGLLLRGKGDDRAIY